MVSSPASTASRRSGPYGLDTDRRKAQVGVAPAIACSGAAGQFRRVVILDNKNLGERAKASTQDGNASDPDRRAGRDSAPGW